MVEMRRTETGHKELHDRVSEFRVETWEGKALKKVETFGSYEEAKEALES